MFPVTIFVVLGNSMMPHFLQGRKVLVQKLWFFCKITVKDVIILKDPRNEQLIIKRVIKIKYDPEINYYVIGDNSFESTDSREFGWIKKSDIIGKVIYGNVSK